MKLGLRREEQRQVSQEKLKAIFYARGKEQQEVIISLDIVLSKVFRKTRLQTSPDLTEGIKKPTNFIKILVLFRIRLIHQWK